VDEFAAVVTAVVSNHHPVLFGDVLADDRDQVFVLLSQLLHEFPGRGRVLGEFAEYRAVDVIAKPTRLRDATRLETEAM
jgi:hypothetical protein